MNNNPLQLGKQNKHPMIDKETKQARYVLVELLTN